MSVVEKSSIHHTNSIRTKVMKLTPVCFATWLSMGYVLSVEAAIVADYSQGSIPTVSVGKNGSTVVDINTPSAGGVSHNKFSSFDVNAGGVVLNNSTANVQSQLSGNLAGNKNLTSGSASIILNEVNSRNASQLNGLVEIAGQKAQVVIANPSGITCNGCGFVNANRATLTTGTPIMEGGKLRGYKIDGGQIAVEGRGMNAKNTNYTDLISRSVKVNANLHANELRVVTGRNTVDNQTMQVTGRDDTIMENIGDLLGPYNSLDVSNLGGMYAGKITLIGTEKGMGVTNSGKIATEVGDLVLSSRGSINNSGTLSARNNMTVSIDSADVNNSGVIQSTGKTNITVGSGVISNKFGTIQTIGGVDLITNGDIDNRIGRIISNGDVNIIAKKVDNSHTYGNKNDRGTLGIKSDSNVNINAQRELSNYDGLIESWSDINVKVEKVDNRWGYILSGYNINLTAKNIDNSAGGLSADNDIYMYADWLDNRKGGFTANNNLTVRTNELANSYGGILAGNTADIIASKSFDNSNGSMVVNDLFLNTVDLNNDAGLIAATHDTSIVANTISNKYSDLFKWTLGKYIGVWTVGGINTANNVAINASSFNNHAGMLSGMNFDMGISGTFNNSWGMAAAGNDFNLRADKIDNAFSIFGGGGTIAAGGNMNATTNALSTDSGSVMNAGKNLSLTVNNHLGNLGRISAGENLTLDVKGRLDNYKKIQAGKDLLIKANGTLSNRGDILAYGNSDIRASYVDNVAYATIQANKNLKLTVDNKLTNSGNILSNEAMSVQAKSIQNTLFAKIAAASGINISGAKNIAGWGRTEGRVTYK